jgi:predicted permease
MARRDISSDTQLLTMAKSSLPLSDRIHRALLRLFPAEFRGDFGEEMAEDFRDQRRDAARSRRPGGLMTLWIRTILDLLARAPREQAETLGADLRFAARMMRRYATSTAVIVVLVAVGIGANAAVFGFADLLMLRPLPVPNARDVVRVLDPAAQTLSHPDFSDLREHTQAFAGIAAHSFVTVSVDSGSGAMPLGGEVVSGNYFDVFGVKPAIGRLLQPADDLAVGAHPVVVISHGLWRERFGGAPSVVGEVTRLNGHPFEVIGVTPESFTGSYTAFGSRFWAPIAMYKQVRPRDLSLTMRGWGWLSLTGRLRPSQSLEQANADLARMAAAIDRLHPVPEPRSYKAVPASGVPEGMRESVEMVLTFATTIAGLVLLVTCANVAGVLQSRAMARVHETSIRYALGASRLRVVRQWLTESLCLALFGAAGGLLAGQWMQSALMSMMPAIGPADPTFPTTFDLRVVLFTVGVAGIAGLLFGLLPAWRSASRGESALRESAATVTGSRSGTRTMRALITLQVAVCLCLLVLAGLLTRSLRNVRSFDPGFETSGLVLAQFDPNRHGYDMTRAATLFEQLSSRLRQYPDVRGISRAAVVPLGGDREGAGYVIAGHRAADGSAAISIATNAVGAGYFTVMGLPILQGHDFQNIDAPSGRRAVVINETMARRFWPNRDPIGQTFNTAGRNGQPVEVIGVVRDIKYYSPTEAPRPYVYVLADQTGARAGTIHLRVNGPADRYVSILKQEMAAIDRTIALDRVITFEQLREQPLALRGAMATLATAFGGIALLLTVVGIYGTMTNAVSQRAREIGVRMAFGAGTADVFRLVVRDGLLPVALGVVAGLALATGVARLVTSELFGVAPTDPLTHVLAVAALTAAALAALSIPATRATRVDPVSVLRA